MTTIAFDTLAIANRLKASGFQPQQAEAIAQEMWVNHSVDISHLSTKEEVVAFKSELKEDLKQFATKQDLKNDLHELELRMTIRLGGMIMALGGVLIAVKYLG